MTSQKRSGCHRCEERLTKRGGAGFVPRASAPPDVCEDCLLPAQAGRRAGDVEVPPFVWPRSPAEIEAIVAEVKAAFKETMDRVASVAEADLTFENVIRPLIDAPHLKTNHQVAQAKHLAHCSTDPAVREAASKAASVFAGLKKDSKSRKDIYEKVKAYSETAEAKALPAYEAHFVSSILNGFERSGLALPPDRAAELRRLLDEHTDVCKGYRTNLAEDKTRLAFSPEELEGCKAEFIKEKTDKETGKVVITLKGTDIVPVMEHCVIAETRRKISITSDTVWANNLELVAKGVQLRKQAANLLGYKSWAHYVTERRMSGCPEKVFSFLGGIEEKAKQGAFEDKEQLRKLKAAHLKERGSLPPEGEAAVRLEPWDVAFYHSMLLQKEYSVDHEALRPYFPCPVVIEQTMAVYQNLLGLKFTKVSDFDAWHPEVQLFAVHDAASGDLQGHFYLDLHPRDGKYNNAAIFHLLKRKKLPGGGWQAPVDCMMANLPAPTADGKPATLRHNDVVTFFHEFGHIMHGLCSEGPSNSTHLAKCPRDFVEAPSQMLENWCFDKGVLNLLSRHVESGAHLPESDLARLLASKNVNAGLMMLRQLYLSLLDLKIHGETPPASVAELQALVSEMRPRISLIDNPPECNILRHFGHLMNQYSASYYGYLWAEVLSADMFESRFAKDPFSKEDGMAYRKMVLAPGGVGNIYDHLVKFLGHEPRQEPFLRSRGILK